ncbi:MAG: AAA family ATPase [bacterium]
MKIAVTGKGGVGKTTISAALCYAFAEKGYKVVAIDADPDANLASALGFPQDETLRPIIEMKDLIEERTGAKPGTSGGFFTLNPKVDDLPEKLWTEHNGIRLMLMGTVKKGGSGCYCAESVLLKALVQHLLLMRDEVVIMDMEAGIEHLGRGTAQAVNHFIVVLEPGMRSIETAIKIKALADDITIKSVYGIANKIRKPSDKDFFKKKVTGIQMLGYIPYEEEVIAADQARLSVWDHGKETVKEIRNIVTAITAEQ